MIDWKDNKLIDWIKRLFWNIKVVIQWLPIIWNSFDFSWIYLIKVIQHKLKSMEEFYESDKPNLMCAKENIKSIKTCRILCERLLDSEYMNCLGLKFKDFNLIAQRCKIGISSDWLNYENYMEKQDLELLCKILQKRLFTWMD